MINNDTIIKQKDFLKKIVDFYKHEKFHILGPKIISLIDNKNQNPQKVLYRKQKDVVKEIIKLRIKYTLNILKIENIAIYVYKNFIKKFLKNMSEATNKEENSDIKLHGSCLIFSKDYIEKYDGLYDKTFMYAEEDILYFIAKRDKLIMKYYPEILIYQKKDSSTNAVLKKDYIKRRFIYKNQIKSLKELYKLMKEVDTWKQ